jgi:hypothetical protein
VFADRSNVGNSERTDGPPRGSQSTGAPLRGGARDITYGAIEALPKAPPCAIVSARRIALRSGLEYAVVATLTGRAVTACTCCRPRQGCGDRPNWSTAGVVRRSRPRDAAALFD